MADGVNPVVDTNLGPSAPPPNPLGTAGGAVGLLGNLADLRNKQNQNILFQQQMDARHKLGEDLAVWSAQGLTPQQQIDAASHQTYAPLVTPEIANIRSSELAGVQIDKTNAEIAEVHQRMVNAGMEKLSQALAATGGDPAKFDGAFKSVVAGYPPELQKDLGKTYSMIKASLTSNLPDDPAAAKQAVVLNTARLGTSFGLPLEKVMGMNGAVVPQAVDMPGGGKSVVGGLPGQTSSALVVQPPGAGGAGAGVPTGVPGGTPGAPAPVTLHSDGSPLFAPDSALPPQFKTNLDGRKAYASPQAEAMANEAAKTYSADQPKYTAIAQSNAAIGNMLAELHTSAKAGGMLTPGFAGESRATLANIINTANEWLNPGTKPPLDPTAVASNEAAAKGARQLAFQTIGGAMGGSEHGLGVLQTAMESVPSLSKTPLGNVVVGEAIQAAGNWMLQKQEFERNWASRTGGDLTNADAEYLKEHPPEKVLQAVLVRHGIKPDGTGMADGKLGVGDSREAAPGVTIRRVK